MHFQRTLPVLAIAITLTLILPVSTLAVSASAVTLNFMCPCGACDEALSTCECPESNGFRSQIAGMVGSGYSEEQVIQDFKGRFGPQVLIANAAMAPNTSRGAFTKKTFGIILLMAGFSLIPFSLGKYMRAAPSPAPAKRRKKHRPNISSKSAKRTGNRENKTGKGFRDAEDDELLDDYDHE